MKNLYIKLCLLALSAFFVQSLHAHDFEVGSIYYNITSSADKTVEVTCKPFSFYYSGTEVIPNKVTYNSITYNVTSISKYAFDDRTGLTSITIPSSVTSIGDCAFRSCSGLTSISIPSSVTSIGNYAFSGCTGLTSVTIPSSVTSIGYDAFWGCTGLTSVTIPSSVTSIGSYAFYGCNNLMDVALNSEEIVSKSYTTSNSLARIFDRQVKQYTLGNNITSIGDCAFSDCTGLTSITIPSSVTSIGDYAFEDCTGLTSITIPSSVTSIGSAAFYGCTGLTAPVFNSSIFAYLPRNFSGEYIIPEGIKQIAGSAFSGCSDLTSVTIPSSVTSIGNYAFKDCTGLTSVTIPSSVTSISFDAFNGCTGLTSVTIPSSVTSIGSSAFRGCTGLTSVTIPSSVTSIDRYAFSGCTGLTSVTISGDDVSISNDAFPSSAKIYVRNHSKTLIHLWNATYGYSSYFSNIYDIETKTYIERPYLECTMRTQTSLTFYITNKVPGYNYSVHLDNKEYKVDDYDRNITVTGLLPETSYSYTLYAEDISIGSSDYTSTSSISRSIGAINITASSFTLNGTCKTGDAELQSTSITVDGKTYDGNTVTFTGLRPSKEYTATYTVEASGKTVTTSTKVTTSSLTLTTAQPKVISAGNVLVSAETNIDPAETNVGFEWRRTDWTDDFASNTGKGYVNGESMEGKIKNLYTEKLWKYRPYYQSSDGTFYYGNWVGIDPTNTSWFEPTVHTYADFSVDGNTVLLKGYTLSGTDNVTEQGFKYWKSSAAAAKGNSAGVTVDAASVPADAQTVAAAGELMSAELTGLDYNSVYYYAAYVKTSTGETFYGEQRSFTIGENPTGIIVVKQDIEEESQTLSTRPVMAGWFTLDGRKLQTAPTRSGIYIHNGKKISLR